MDDAKRRQRAIVQGSILGVLLALGMGIAFGVLDVQCRADPAGRFWNANEQKCQANEVTN